MKDGYATEAILDGSIVEGWILLDVNHPLVSESYRIVLRRPLDEQIGTAESIGVLLSYDGYITQVCQYVPIQNDNDYRGSGFERFGALWLAQVH